MTNYVSIRSGASAIPEENLMRWATDLFSASGVFNKAGGQWLVTESNPKARSVDIAEGAGIFYGASMSYHGFSSAANTGVAVTANSSGNPRIDTIVAYVDKAQDPTTDASSVLKFVAVAGTPAGSPSAPSGATIQAAVGAGNPYLVLANVACANGFTQIANADITDTRVDATFALSKLVATLLEVTQLSDTNGNETIKTPATTSAVNELTVTNSATGDAVQLSATGGDTNINLKLVPKGSGIIDLGTKAYASAITDDAGNEVLKTAKTSSAVNEVTATNAATGNVPKLSASGGDTDIDLGLEGKGAGLVKPKASYQDIVTDTYGATTTMDLSVGNYHKVTLEGDGTLAVSNFKPGQTLTLLLYQDGVGSHTPTWFAGITWNGNVVPTVTSTASKLDVYQFLCIATDTYIGSIFGQGY